jgi:NTP pyrophosphatase (non-canonical NTP hydrolase)
MEKRESMTALDICRSAVASFGKEAQTRKAVEELTELSLALQHSVKAKTSHDNICEEIADVKIMLLQLEIMYDHEGCVSRWTGRKLERLEKLIPKK